VYRGAAALHVFLEVFEVLVVVNYDSYHANAVSRLAGLARFCWLAHELRNRLFVLSDNHFLTGRAFE
jgi:hypothetical protein